VGGVGGAGMLRTRRRDVSVKPNRKLDRKSSRGMIYENEELRLRTIHINAEVEQASRYMYSTRKISACHNGSCSRREILPRARKNSPRKRQRDTHIREYDGQNDIKKLRRENEQLRREIWSLRDEYDKLEEILKKQKNRDESEEYEVS
ncbi:hypothetical protein EAG_13511, partial [Camponotus floridanus]